LVNRAPYLLPGSRSKAMADIGRSMAYLAVNTFGKGHDDPKLTTDGFKNDLVKDGQGGDVYKHIYGHAGAMLIGNSGARLPIFGKSGYQYTDENLALDIDQRDHPEKYPGHSAAEAATEVRDDYAARDIGRLMGQRMHGNISRDDLRQRIFSILCEH
jgi:hypothetical protein